MRHCALFLTVLLTLFTATLGQVTSTTSDGRNNPVPSEVQKAEATIARIIAESEKSFREGLIALQDNRRSIAREKFDRSVEAFLISGINLNSNNNAKARDCYNQLIETVYRMEFPNQAQVPQIRSLSATCGWNIDNDMADKVARLVLTVPQTPQQATTSNNSLLASVVPNTNQSSDSLVSFTDQKFEPSPLDDLSKLELTPEEQDVESNKNKTKSGKSPIYVRPVRPQTTNSTVLNTRIVKAVSGDTVAKIASRYGVNPVDVANYNGLTSITAPLTAGREVKIPISSKQPQISGDLGIKPAQSKDGKVKAVMDYFNENLNDPYSMRIVRWSPVFEKTYKYKKYWSVQVKYRAKNLMGAYVLSEQIFYIKNNKVVETERIY